MTVDGVYAAGVYVIVVIFVAQTLEIYSPSKFLVYNVN